MTDRPTVQKIIDHADRFARLHGGASHTAARFGALIGLLKHMDAEGLTPSEYVERYCANEANS